MKFSNFYLFFKANNNSNNIKIYEKIKIKLETDIYLNKRENLRMNK